jgi:hypothetical protein
MAMGLGQKVGLGVEVSRDKSLFLQRASIGSLYSSSPGMQSSVALLLQVAGLPFRWQLLMGTSWSKGPLTFGWDLLPCDERWLLSLLPRQVFFVYIGDLINPCRTHADLWQHLDA